MPSVKVTIKFFSCVDSNFQMLQRKLFFTACGQCVRRSYGVFDLKLVSVRLIKIFTNLQRWLTCRPLRSFLISPSKSVEVMFTDCPIAPEFCKNAVQIFFFADWVRWSYFKAKCIRLWNASSNVVTRFVVRNMMPWKYSNWRRNTDTNAFRWRFWRERCSRNTSASSRSRIAFQWRARCKMQESRSSNVLESVPNSPAHTCKGVLWRVWINLSNGTYSVKRPLERIWNSFGSQRFSNSRWATKKVSAKLIKDIAQEKPYWSSTTRPLPFPLTKSSNGVFRFWVVWLSASARTTLLRSSGITRCSKGDASHSISLIWETENSATF